MFSSIGRRKLTYWGGWRSRIGVVILEECIGVLDCVIRGIQNFCVRCRNVEELIGSSVLNILIDLFHLEMHCLRFKGERSHAIEYDLVVIVEDSAEHCFWVDIHV